ncbi:hypothetical protein A1F94_005662 [Pyrenophora tritici-repentis]|uniref:Secreted protein n=1 Tax=Pyrenophora tritici-repentis TaxID=45151 RepID=A0A317A6L7_9PLEO|nr:hypothetical protein PtrM4_106830 [Pyrenophora tritici-repentis]KAG9383751.1 hypothetical protein A1F94_005662 [Pyrenophora tritici-repentis]KAI1514406.1 hypothetical protein Ptr86124_007036 [Pyrenophora tritici-repentis]KAI1666965.1 hypothetical protein L13192_09209 [Pyrenophora tritici-repentis]KAI1682811.1 hypothetical protein KJE20_07543 [Pyrenophora tritici-repentis]
MLELTLVTTLILALLVYLFQRRHDHHDHDHIGPAKSTTRRRRTRGRRAILEAQDRIGAHRTCLSIAPAPPAAEIDHTSLRNLANDMHGRILDAGVPSSSPSQPQPIPKLRIVTQYEAAPAAAATVGCCC